MELKTYRMQQKQSRREVYSNTILPQETRKIDNLTSYLKQLEKEEQKSPQN